MLSNQRLNGLVVARTAADRDVGIVPESLE